VKWEIVKDPCPATECGQHICQLRAGHAGQHLTTLWEYGEITGPYSWDEEVGQ
jgi:hypothetical protein